MAESKKLTAKQTKFVKEYVANDGNGTKAALAAYDTTDENTAHAIASQNLQKLTVAEAIEVGMAEQGITMDKALKPIATALNSNDMDTQFKGSDRFFKLVGAGKDQAAPNIHFHQHVENKKSEYDF